MCFKLFLKYIMRREEKLHRWALEDFVSFVRSRIRTGFFTVVCRNV